MEAEVRVILATVVNEARSIIPYSEPPRSQEEMSERLRAVRGLWRDRAAGKTTDEIMKELRGDD